MRDETSANLAIRGEVFVHAIIERQPAKDFAAGFHIACLQCETVETKIVHRKSELVLRQGQTEIVRIIEVQSQSRASRFKIAVAQRASIPQFPQVAKFTGQIFLGTLFAAVACGADIFDNNVSFHGPFSFQAI